MLINKLSILIPVYNEENTLLKLLTQVKNVELINNIQKEFIIVDDGSKDNSIAIVKEFISDNPDLDVKFYPLEKNVGKGGAIHEAISHASGEYLIIQDADLEYDPNEYNKLLQPILREEADIVYGSRFLGNQPHQKSYFTHHFANKFLTFLSNIFSNLKLTDMETCYKLLKTDIIQSIPLTEKRFGFEPEVTAKLSRIKNLRLKEVEISYYGRKYDDGKKIGWKDGVKAIYCILKYGMLRFN